MYSLKKVSIVIILHQHDNNGRDFTAIDAGQFQCQTDSCALILTCLAVGTWRTKVGVLQLIGVQTVTSVETAIATSCRLEANMSDCLQTIDQQ